MKKLSMDELHRISVEQFREAEKTPLVVVLDNVRSQNNIGSVFRTGDAFRIEKLYLCGITARPPQRDIHKTALGAEDSVCWQYEEKTEDCVRALKQQGYKVYAVEQVDDSVMLNQWKAPAEAKVAIILGNEVDGVQQELIPLCDGCIEIPQFGTKHSLNISCAASIVMWDIFKQLKLR
jgi:tRNA G18 (ribose-2'-O)-methylase SpoU